MAHRDGTHHKKAQANDRRTLCHHRDRSASSASATERTQSEETPPQTLPINDEAASFDERSSPPGKACRKSQTRLTSCHSALTPASPLCESGESFSAELCQSKLAKGLARCP